MNCKQSHVSFVSVSNSSPLLFSYQRDWRYHTEEKIWIMRVPGQINYDTSGTMERGTYYYFDAQNWRRVPKEFQIDTKKLDTKPPITLS